jgi:hypothetical protein
MSKENIWTSALKRTIEPSAENAKGILDGICEELEQATKGRVHARFKAIKYKVRSIEALGLIPSDISQEVIDENAPNLKDASELYDSRRYGFDIVNDTYRYRPFEASIGALYPIKLYIDETIVRESTGQLTSWLSSEMNNTVAIVYDDEGLKECIRVIISSNKMAVILQRLVSQAQRSVR